MNPMKPRIGVAALLALVAMVWLAAGMGTWDESFPLKEQKDDYYNLLVDGFQEGHLYMKAPMHSDRLSPDAEVRKRAPYLLDASQYNGRYYLYFGVVPALLLFWPYAALTGHDCPPNLAVLLAAAAAFLFWLRLYTEARTRYFPATRGWFDVTAVGLLAFATGLPVLLVSGGMYEVALAWGGAWTALMAWCLFRALHAPRGVAGWLALASFAFGLGVGSRPTIFLLGPLLPVAACLAARVGKRDWLRLAGAIVIPAGLIGLGLMLYNQARFDSPFEFGLSHQINAIAGTKLQSLSFVPANAGWYYLKPPTFSVFFPYFFPQSGYPVPDGYYVGSEPTHGQFILLVLAVASALGLLWRQPAVPRLLRWFGGLLLVAFGLMLLVNATFAYRSNRYLVDFQPALVLLVLLAAGLILQPGTRPGRLARLWSWMLAMLTTAAWVSSLLIAMQFLDRFAGKHLQAYPVLAHYGNYPASWLARLGWHHYGPVRFKVVFTRPPHPVYEVLFSSGAPSRKDVLFAAQYPGGHLEFIMYHEGHGEERSRLIPIEYGRAYEIELDLGSLYPPVAATYFPRWGELPREILKGVTRVSLDGTPMIQTRQHFHDSSPGLLEFGRATGRPEQPFSGRIFDLRRRPMPDPAALRAMAETGVWRFEFTLPPRENLLGQPLLSSGVAGRGNLLFLQNLSDGNFRFGLDFWGVGADFSPPLDRLSDGPHRLDIFVSSQFARKGPTLSAGEDLGHLQADFPQLRLWLDGRLVWAPELIAHADTYDFVGLGTNTQGYSTAGPLYAGQLHSLLLEAADIRALLGKKLPSTPP